MPLHRRLCLLMFLVSALSAAFAREPGKVDLLYVVENFWPSPAKLHTYTVDPYTAAAREVAAPITISPNASNPIISPDDHFLYFYGGDYSVATGTGQEHIWVYATDSHGAPGSTPVQVLNVKNLSSLLISPSPKFAFAVETTVNGQGQTISKIRKFTVTPATGMLSKSSEVVASYGLNGPCGTGWSVSGELILSGFNYDGSQLYETWLCSAHDWLSNIYYRRSVDTQTGRLGSEIQRFAASGFDAVYFRKNSIVDYNDPAGVFGDATVYFFPPNGGEDSLFSCTSEMLAACASGYGVLPDLTGRFVVLQASPGSAEIAKVDISARSVVDTGNSIPASVLQFSPDNHLLYTQSPGSWTPPFFFPIYAFDSQTGAVQQGDTLEVQSQFYSLTPVVRY